MEEGGGRGSIGQPGFPRGGHGAYSAASLTSPPASSAALFAAALTAPGAKPVPSSSKSSLQPVVGISDAVGDEAKFVPVEDLKSERERWLQMCMHEVWNLENAAFEKINSQIEEATRRLQSDVTKAVLHKVEDERADRVASTAELRKDLRSQTGALEAGLAALRGDLTAMQAMVGDALRLQRRDDAGEVALTSVRAQASATDAAVADIRSELAALRESQELQAASSLSDFRQELSGLQLTQMQALHEQGARYSSDLARAIQEATASADAARTLLKVELRQEMDKLRGELEERSQADDQAATVGRAEATKEFGMRIEELSRGIQEAKQDALSETTVLRGRLEAAVGDRQEQLSQLDTLQLLLKDEQGRRAADNIAIQGRLEALERRINAGHAEAAPTAAVADVSTLARLDSLEVASRKAAEDAGAQAAQVALLQRKLAEAPMTSLSARMDAMAKDLATLWEKVGAAVATPRPASPSASPSASLRADMEKLRGEVSKLAQDLLDERRDRCRALTDVNRITEDVARAAAATIERAEKKFADEHASGLQPRQGEAETSVGSAASTRAASIGRAPSQPPSRAAEAAQAEGSLANSSDDIRSAMGSGFARLVGEMDAELRVELTSRIRLLTAELRGEIMRDVALRISSSETSMSTQLGDVAARIGKMEAVQLGQRVAALEEEAKRHFLMLTAAAEERKRRNGGLEALDEGARHAGGEAELATTAEGPTASICSESTAASGTAAIPAIPATAAIAAGAAQGVAAIEQALAGGTSKIPEGLKASLDSLVSALDRSMGSRQVAQSPAGSLRKTTHEAGDSRSPGPAREVVPGSARGDPGGTPASGSHGGISQGAPKVTTARSHDSISWGNLNDRASALGATYRDNALRGRSSGGSPPRTTVPTTQQQHRQRSHQGPPSIQEAPSQASAAAVATALSPSLGPRNTVSVPPQQPPGGLMGQGKVNSARAPSAPSVPMHQQAQLAPGRGSGLVVSAAGAGRVPSQQATSAVGPHSVVGGRVQWPAGLQRSISPGMGHL